MVLVIIGVALIFFEHGKRIASKAEKQKQSRSPFDRAEHGAIGLELTDRNLPDQKEMESEIKEEEPLTPLLYNKRKSAVELDGAVMDKFNDTKRLEIEKEQKKRILSVRSIYELG